jgi:hypothetical protein
MPDIVHQRQRLGQVGIQAKRRCRNARNLCNLEGMREPAAGVVTLKLRSLLSRTNGDRYACAASGCTRAVSGFVSKSETAIRAVEAIADLVSGMEERSCISGVSTNLNKPPPE